ncbi:gastrula zinc finger isoform X1 [Octopus vulgaris]|uniref:Gastrula zinc finger isoform X1 n=2 Tax=Octopus TaxID=6643 RepID=A0AA36F3T8_OCTVU|nr:zinc finger protein 26 isoform X2 [Octopus sinensis]CAI9722840.1 gastrula zinc finger isoform X1 [Octopus vulgaris]
MVYEQAYLDQDHGSQAMTVLCELWKKQTLCDATVQAGSYKIKVHKTVLMVASPTLLALCQNGPCEGHLQVQLPINLRGVDALHCFIMYLYEGLLNLNEESVMEVLNIASYLQVETVVKFCLSFLDSAKEQNVVLKAALSSPYDTCLYKVLNESLSKSSESTTNKNSNWVYQPESTNIKTKIIHKPLSLSSSETSIVISERKDKSFYVENLNFKGNSLSSSQAGESSSSKNISEASNEAVQIQYNIIDDEIKPNIAPQNSSTSENFVVQEISETYSFSQNNNHSSPSSDSHLLKLKETNDKIDSKLHHSSPIEVELESSSSPTVYEIEECDSQEKMVIGQIGATASSDKVEFICTICHTSFLFAEIVVSHLRNVHNVLLDDIPEFVVVGSHSSGENIANSNSCIECGFSSQNPDYLPFHRYFQHAVPLPANCTLFKCEFCNAEFIRKRGLTEHIQQFHKDEAHFMCEHCGRTYKIQNCLQKHIYNCHNSERKWSCLYCGRTFKKQDHLKVHIRLHTHEKPFACHVCDYKSTTKGNLKAHLMRRHSIDIDTVEHFKINKNKTTPIEISL